MKTRATKTVPDGDIAVRAAPVLVTHTLLSTAHHVTRASVTGAREAGYLQRLYNCIV